ncbi:MAG: hypothetical protein WC421_00615 [Elusimicrobiales bacterium]
MKRFFAESRSQLKLSGQARLRRCAVRTANSRNDARGLKAGLPEGAEPLSGCNRVAKGRTYEQYVQPLASCFAAKSAQSHRLLFMQTSIA